MSTSTLSFQLQERLALLLDESDFPIAAPVQDIVPSNEEMSAFNMTDDSSDDLTRELAQFKLSAGVMHDHWDMDISQKTGDINQISTQPQPSEASVLEASTQAVHDYASDNSSVHGDINNIASGGNHVTSGSRLLIGTLATLQESFCPIMAISKFPYKFVRDKELSDRISGAFFNDGRFWRRTWDIYYIWSPRSNIAKPLLLVPSIQVEQLLGTINKEIKDARLSLNSVADFEPGIRLTFNYKHDQLRPRYLGQSASQEQFNDMSRNAPGESYRPPTNRSELPTPQPQEDQMVECKLKIDFGLDLCRARKASKAARKEQRLSTQLHWVNDLKQIERFLGLRPVRHKEPEIPQDESWAQYQAREAAKQAAKLIPPVNTSLPPPYPFESAVIFVSIDIECYERDKRKITEIGVSTLDTMDLARTPPGQNASNWFSAIRSRHFRIREHSHLNNTEFVQGCAADFRFGKSEFIALDEGARMLATCFRHPYSAPPGHAQSSPDVQRTIVLVGHDFANDISYMKQRLGYDVTNLSTLHRNHSVADTQGLYRALTQQWDAARLAAILDDFDITPWSLHNAGNDAAYTLQAMLAIAVRSGGERGSREARKRRDEANRCRIAEAVKLAAQRALEEGDGWSSGDDVAEVRCEGGLVC